MFEERNTRKAPPPRCGRCREILGRGNVSGYCRACRKALGLQSGAAVNNNPGRKGGKALTVSWGPKK